MAIAESYRVVIRHNLVIAVENVELSEGDEVPEDNLEVTLALAQNYRQHGSIDGEYLFSSVHRAKDFALVALDFVKKLMEKSEQGLEGHNFYSQPAWHNPSAADLKKLQH